MLAKIIVLCIAAYLIAQAFAVVFARELVTRYLSAFASSARAHYLEQGLRLVAGAALVSAAPQMRFSAAVSGFGWIVVVTTLGLLLIPWRWHHRFAQWAIPLAIRNLTSYAVGSLLLGLVLLAASLR